jgi:hypothetical protein
MCEPIHLRFNEAFRLAMYSDSSRFENNRARYHLLPPAEEGSRTELGWRRHAALPICFNSQLIVYGDQEICVLFFNSVEVYCLAIQISINPGQPEDENIT